MKSILSFFFNEDLPNNLIKTEILLNLICSVKMIRLEEKLTDMLDFTSGLKKKKS